MKEMSLSLDQKGVFNKKSKINNKIITCFCFVISNNLYNHQIANSDL